MHDVSEVQLWLERVEDLSIDAADADVDDVHAVLSEWSRILEARPFMLAALIHGAPSPVFHACMATEAFESASLSLLATNINYMLSRGGDGTYIATLMITNCGEEFTRKGRTLALAVASAHIAAISSLCYATSLRNTAPF